MVTDGDFGPITDSQRRALADAELKAEDLLALIEDLLEVARLEETTISLVLTQIAPAALLSEIIHEWRLRFQQDGVTVRKDVGDDVPVFVADQTLLKRVFSNLIQNAVTHSAKAVELQLAARLDGDGILFTVADNGPGIPREYQELIFRKFEQVRTPNAPRVRSSGLGLTFCKMAVEAHGGRIWVQSEEGQGSAFHIRLPLMPASETAVVRSAP
jgi:two-component system sensor histidine kinase/response regulator